MSDKPQFVVRTGNEEDWNFVYATWLRSFKRSSYFAKHIQDALFFENHHKIVEAILRRGALVRVATPAEDPATILGYLVGEGEVVHFIYVKKSFRGFGVARSLLSQTSHDSQFSHWTYDADYLLKKYPKAVYNPYAAERGATR
jgi:GNAT superfamily N-acetyltransferase